MKTRAIVILTMVTFFAIGGVAYATTALLPVGSKVSATVDVAKGTATVTIAGADISSVEFYAYEGVKRLGAVEKFTVNLREGRRFNFTVGGNYALLTPEMAAYPPDFFGSGIGMDCGNPSGCAFLITGD